MWVNGACPYVAEILTFGYILWSYLTGNLICSLFHLLRIAVGQTVLCQYGVHLCVILTCRTQYVNHLSDDSLRVSRRPRDNLHHSLVARLTTLQLATWDDDVAGEDIAIEVEECYLRIHLQRSHEGIPLMRQDFCNHCLLDMVTPTCHHGHPDTITVHRPHGIALRNEYGFVGSIRNKRVLAIDLTHELTFEHLSLGVQSVGIIRNLAEEVVPCHLLHHVDRKHLQRMSVELQSLEDLFETEGFFRMLLKEGCQEVGYLRFIMVFTRLFHPS